MDIKIANQPESPLRNISEAESRKTTLVENYQFYKNTPQIQAEANAKNDLNVNQTTPIDHTIEDKDKIEDKKEQQVDVIRKAVDYHQVKDMVFGSPQTSNFKNFAELFNKLVY